MNDTIFDTDQNSTGNKNKMSSINGNQNEFDESILIKETTGSPKFGIDKDIKNTDDTQRNQPKQDLNDRGQQDLSLK